jgi:hypothetical protein
VMLNNIIWHCRFRRSDHEWRLNLVSPSELDWATWMILIDYGVWCVVVWKRLDDSSRRAYYRNMLWLNFSDLDIKVMARQRMLGQLNIRCNLIPANCYRGHGPQAQPTGTYSLVGVICHTGNAHSGHYTCIVCRLESSRWYHISDSCVLGGNCELWRCEDAYILFYERQD